MYKALISAMRIEELRDLATSLTVENSDLRIKIDELEAKVSKLTIECEDRRHDIYDDGWCEGHDDGYCEAEKTLGLRGLCGVIEEKFGRKVLDELLLDLKCKNA